MIEFRECGTEHDAREDLPCVLDGFLDDVMDVLGVRAVALARSRDQGVARAEEKDDSRRACR